MFLQQQGNDPFTEVPERIAQANAVANRIARFITLAQATLDIAIYDFRLYGEPAAIIVEAICRWNCVFGWLPMSIRASAIGLARFLPSLGPLFPSRGEWIIGTSCCSTFWSGSGVSPRPLG
jgi:hypothetical protein